MPIDARTKETLKAGGKWEMFYRRRDELKRSGMDAQSAQDLALKELQFEENRAAAASVEAPKSACLPAEEPLFTREEFDEFIGRDADVIEVVQWVAKHLEVPESLLRMEDAPCAEAWGMLMVYRKPANKAVFWDKIYSKLLPSRAQLDNRTTVTVDGGNIMAACEKILKIKSKVEGEE